MRTLSIRMETVAVARLTSRNTFDGGLLARILVLVIAATNLLFALAIAVIVLVLLGMVTAARGAGAEALVDRDGVADQVAQVWRNADWDALDHLAAVVVNGYERDANQFAPYRTFFYVLPRDGSGATQDAYGQWVARHPKSYAAHYARARYYSYLAMDARGSDFTGNTPKKRLELMEQWLGLARSEAITSLELSSRPTLSYFQLMRIARYLGDGTSITEYYDAAVTADPDVFLVAEERLISLQPRWGGDFRDLQQFPDEAAQRGLRGEKLIDLRRKSLLLSGLDMTLYGQLDEAEEVLRQLLSDSTSSSYRDAALLGLVDIALKRDDIDSALKVSAELAAMPNGSPDFLATAADRLADKGRNGEAERYYKVCLSRNPEHYQALLGLALLARDGRRPQDALGYLDRVLTSAPDDPRGLSERGWLRVNSSGDVTGGIEDLRRAAMLGDDFAQNILGALSWEGKVVRKDPADAIYWWIQGADLGNEDALRNLQMAERRLGAGFQQLADNSRERVEQDAMRARLPPDVRPHPTLGKNWWAPAVQWTLWGVVMTVVMGWLAKSRMKERPASDADTLRQPAGILIMGLIGVSFFVGLAVVSNTIGKNSTTSIWTTLGFLFFAAMSLPMVADYFLGRHLMSQEGLDYGKLLGKRGYARWGEIRSITYVPMMKWFKLRTASGATIRISATLMGLPAFAQYVLAHVPPERIDGPTRALLVETANGTPPRLWN